MQLSPKSRKFSLFEENRVLKVEEEEGSGLETKVTRIKQALVVELKKFETKGGKIFEVDLGENDCDTDWEQIDIAQKKL